MEERTKNHLLSKEMLVPISLVFTLLGAAMSYGAMYNKVDGLQNLVELERSDRKEDISDLKEQVAEVQSLLIEVLKKNQISLGNR